MRSFFPKLILGLSGTVLLIIGTAMLVNPLAFAGANGVSLPDSASVLSEYRAPGGLLGASGLLMIVATASQRWMPQGLLAGAMVYCTFGLSRLLGYAVDGPPSTALTQAMIVELVMGAACLTTFIAVGGGRKMMAPPCLPHDEATR